MLDLCAALAPKGGGSRRREMVGKLDGPGTGWLLPLSQQGQQSLVVNPPQLGLEGAVPRQLVEGFQQVGLGAVFLPGHVKRQH